MIRIPTIFLKRRPTRNDPEDKSEHKLTFMQTLIMISSTLIGAGVLTLPRSAAETGSPSGWLMILLQGVIFIIIVLLFLPFLQKNSEKTLFKLNNIVAGTFIGFLLNLYICLYFIGIVCFQARILGEIVGFFGVYISCSCHLSCGRRRLFNCKGIRLYFSYNPYYFYDASDVQLSLVPVRFYPACF